MVNNDYSIDYNTIVKSFGKHVSANIGTNYCIVSSSKHSLPEFVKAIDELYSKGWVATSGFTSEDGKVFQSVFKLSFSSEQLNKVKGV